MIRFVIFIFLLAIAIYFAIFHVIPFIGGLFKIKKTDKKSGKQANKSEDSDEKGWLELEDLKKKSKKRKGK